MNNTYCNSLSRDPLRLVVPEFARRMALGPLNGMAGRKCRIQAREKAEQFSNHALISIVVVFAFGRM